MIGLADSIHGRKSSLLYCRCRAGQGDATKLTEHGEKATLLDFKAATPSSASRYISITRSLNIKQLSGIFCCVLLPGPGGGRRSAFCSQLSPLEPSCELSLDLCVILPCVLCLDSNLVWGLPLQKKTGGPRLRLPFCLTFDTNDQAHTSSLQSCPNRVACSNSGKVFKGIAF